MRIAHISDSHVVAQGDTLDVAPMAQNLEKVVASLNGFRPDLVLVSGDIANTARAEETLRAARILAGLEMPYYVTLGNHDDRDVIWDVFGGSAMPAREPEHLSYVFDAGRYRIISLDSTDPDFHNGHICEARAAWLDMQLTAAPSTPTLVFMHHPPMKCGVEETDSPPLKGADRLAEVMCRHPQIKRILCGHIHLSVQAVWQGHLVVTAPSLGMRLRFDPDREAESAFYVAPPSYLLHIENTDGNLVSHQINLDNPPGPFSFG